MANLGYLQLTRACGHKCIFCSAPPTGKVLSDEQMRGLIDHLAEMGYDGVILTGGEPTLSPKVFDALAYAKELGLHSRMITNGQKFSNPKFFEKCVERGLTHLHVSLHSYRPEVHDFLTAIPGSWEKLVTCLSLVPEMGIQCDINSVINSYNSDHLHETVMWICDQFPFIRHFVWNNMDPDGNRSEENPDCIPRHHEFHVSLDLAMEYLDRTGRTFRAERVPLCYMQRFPWASTETRKIIKDEERCIRFLGPKGFVRQRAFRHGKSKVCDACGYNPICAGIFSMGRKYDEVEASPVFEDPAPVIERVLGRKPSTELIEAILARHEEWEDDTHTMLQIVGPM